jgi:hypothetical protein
VTRKYWRDIFAPPHQQAGREKSEQQRFSTAVNKGATMKYLTLDENNVADQANEIDDDMRTNAEDGSYIVFRFHNGAFERLVVSRDEGDDTGETFGNDDWESV